ncbi:MAG: bifunctional metallophosphatase/5'-nucleotidase [Firmicutes bacterium]|nr:bifunctional metallophosphatase/5'-nucleotidase [Bacillota bacterium]
MQIRVHNQMLLPGFKMADLVSRSIHHEDPQSGKTPGDRFETIDDHQHITILHTNDLHAQLESTSDGANVNKQMGGMSVITGKINEEREKCEGSYLVLDAGDISSGSPVSNYFKGIPMIDMLNSAEYDAMVIGNHDIDEGSDALKAMVDRAKFPILASNLVDKTETGELSKVQPYIIKQCGNIKVGIVGVTTQDTMSMLRPDDKKKIELTVAETAVRKSIDQMKEEGAKIIVVLSHLGLEGDKQLAENVKGIHLIVGGHSHSELTAPVKVGDTAIVQTGTAGRNLGKVELDVVTQKGETKISAMKSKLIPVEVRGTTEQLFVNNLVHTYSEKLAPIMNEKIGNSTVELSQPDYHTNVGESPLTNFVIDTIREHTGADVAIMHSSTLRTKIPAGEIKKGTIYQMLPWNTHLTDVKMTGKQIRQGIEEIMGSFLHNFTASGLIVEFDTSKMSGEKVVNLYDKSGKPLDPEKTYNVTTISWLADGNANVSAFQNGSDRVDRKTELKEILMDKIKTTGTITAGIDGRTSNLASAHSETC